MSGESWLSVLGHSMSLLTSCCISAIRIQPTCLVLDSPAFHAISNFNTRKITCAFSTVHLYTIAVWHMHSMFFVASACAHASKDSLLHMIVFAQAISQTDYLLPNTHLLSVKTCLGCTRECGQASSWNNRCWAPPAMKHTKNCYSGWSKRATRGYHSDNDDGPVSRRTESQVTSWNHWTSTPYRSETNGIA